MCGICGIVDFTENVHTNRVREMCDAMIHRGPDASGISVFDRCILGHRRLSIIDLSDSANQPMVHQPTGTALIFNGEIYNFNDLRKDLESQGIRFRTNSDTEVILQMYLAEGGGLLERLNGMFSFAIWRPESESVFLARDRVGKKPLYYAIQGGRLTFASELGALIKGLPHTPEINQQALFEYFLYDFVPWPHTIFKGVYKLPPASAAIFDREGWRQWRYWHPPIPQPDGDYASTREALKSLLLDSTEKRMISDVPLGSFLSGGVDSSLITSLMKGISKGDVKTFSISFPGATHDESKWSRYVANQLGADHREYPCAYDVQSVLSKMIPHFGAPFADCSAIPTWHLCKRTKERVTVALSGDGGDELFGGYDRYLARRLQCAYDHLPGPLREKFIEPIVEKIPETTDYYGTSPLKKLRLFTRAAKRFREEPLAVIPRTFSRSQVRSLLGFDYEQDMDPTIEVARSWVNLDPVSHMLFTDMQTYMAEDILTKVDRMSMAHSLEVRSPLLDYRVVETACRAPIGFKIKGMVLKRLLKDISKDFVAPAILKRPKYGFQVPLGQWFKNDLRDWAQSRLFDSNESALNKKFLEKLWGEHQSGASDHGLRIWSALVFLEWREWLNSLKRSRSHS